ncbi:MAG: SGNH/GDSL hydrolase family protein [Myxococcota bacterium]|nr:SGNH/GDSL hydrolase family protein [Myxococcota bacterium]
MNREAITHFFIPVLGVLIGVFLGLQFIHGVFVRVQHPMTRDRIMLEALASDETAPQLAIFGNSIAMCGVDAKRLGDSLHRTALNLATGARNPMESLFYYKDLHDNIEVVIQFAMPSDLNIEPQMNADRYDAFRIYGYELDAQTEKILRSAFQERAGSYLDRSALKREFGARWALRSSIDEGVRDLLRNDLSVQRSIYDLYYPCPYTKRVPEPAMKRDLASRRERSARQTAANPQAAEILRAMTQRTREQGRRLLFVIPPAHPEIRNNEGAVPTRLLAEFLTELAEQPGVELLNTFDLLEADEFVDAVHPTAAGAERLTALLTARLGEML